MKNQLKTLLLLGVLSAILVAIGGVLGGRALWIFAIAAVALNFGAYFFSDRMVLAMHHAREVDASEAPRLHAVVQDLAAQAGLPMPRVFVVPQPQPNAFATGRTPQKSVVAVTEGLLALLDDRELRGVLAHELGHVKNRDVFVSTVAATLAAVVTYVGFALRWGALFGGFGGRDRDGGVFGLLGMAIVAPIAATLVQLGISRSREYLADETGARISGDPEALASALEKIAWASGRLPRPQVNPAAASLYIVNPFSGAALTRLLSTHPPTEERIARLRRLAGRFH